MKNGINRRHKLFGLFAFLLAIYFLFTKYSDKKVSNVLCQSECADLVIHHETGNSALSTMTIECNDTSLETEIKPHGDYFLLKNFIRSRLKFKCDESITYVTHSDFTFLDNVIPLVKRWEAPLSIAVYAPGSDFNSTLKVIFYLRNCIEEKELVKDFVTFHIFFEKEFFYEEMMFGYEEAEKLLECSEISILKLPNETYKSVNNLTYPVNVARNLARNSSMTHLVLVSDIELYPSVNFVKSFFQMLSKYSTKLNLNRDVFVFPIFEVVANQKPPSTKRKLLKLFKAKKAFWFHYKICPSCHQIPFSKEWLKDNSTEMRIASRNKRTDEFYHWEPLYVGTKNDPLYDERLDWEGKSDKMTQAYIMCILDYTFNILSNAFLVHRPGIKTSKEASRPNLENINREIISYEIIPEIIREYGYKRECRAI